MDETPSTNSSKITPAAGRSNVWLWFLACLGGTFAVSLLAAHAPPRIRLIGLFSIVFGLVIGRLIVLLAEKLEANPPRSLLAIAAILLSIAGLAGATWESFRAERASLPADSKNAIAKLLIDQMRSEQSPTTAPKYDTSQLGQFRRYLSGRLQQLGDWSSPWPELFWMAELFAAAVAGVWITIGGGSRLWQTRDDLEVKP